jgi:hypothetical protein
MNIPETVLGFLVKDKEEVAFAAHCHGWLAYMYIFTVSSLSGSRYTAMIVRNMSWILLA